MGNEDKQYTVIIQGPAKEMLLTHSRFLAQVSENAAIRLVEDFVSKAKTLEYLPERYPWITGSGIPHRKYRKLVFDKYYMLVFQVVENNVYIDAMVDCRQDYRWLL